MNKKLLISLLVCIGLPLMLYFLSVLGSGKINWADLGITFFFAGLIYFLPGLIMALVRNHSSRDIGKGMLLASALLILVGFSVCSMSPMNFH